MGACLTWFAVKGREPDIARAELGLRSTGRWLDYPKVPRIAGAPLKSGWYLIQRYRYECRNPAVYARLSAGCEVVSLFVEEHVMVSWACAWKNGKRLWWVKYDSEKGEQHLEFDGEPPPEFFSLRARVQAKPDAGIGDYFDIPCGVARALAGYCYDGFAAERRISSFEVLKRIPWWQRLGLFTSRNS